MRIGLISYHSFYQPGGVKRHILGLHKEFKKRGIYSKIIAPRRKLSEDYGKDIILLGTSFPLNFSGTQGDFNVNFNPLAIEKVFKEEKFNVLHFHNFGFPSAYQILEKSEALNILTFHANITGSKFFKRFPGFLYLLNKIVQWKMDGIIGVAALNVNVFKRYNGPKIVIPNGIDLDEFKSEGPKIKKFLDKKINILFVGRFEERKGLIYLLRAYKILLKKFVNLRLIIIGDGDLKSEYEKYVKENNLKEVCFEGKITGPELSSYYRTCDIFCSPAIFGESFGLVLLEAMACSKPIAAFANQGYKELLRGKSGEKFLAKPRDYQGLAQKLETLIENSDLRKKMGEWGLKEAQKYSWSKVADNILDFYQFCNTNKEQRKKNNFSIEEILKKLAQKNVKELFNWLK